jgi:subtilisin-like proprotein convertase family protein
MPKKIFSYFVLLLLLLLSNGSGNFAASPPEKSPEGETGTLEKMIVANGKVSMDLDLSRLIGIDPAAAKESKMETLRFQVGPNSFFAVLVFNNIFRGPEQSSMELVLDKAAAVPGQLQASLNQLVIEKLPADAPFDLAVRDGKTGFVFFNVEGNLYEYDAPARLLTIKEGRLLVSEEFAKSLGRSAEAGAIAGRISIAATMSAIETTTLVNGAVQSSILPPLRRGAGQDVPNFVPGPDVIVGDLSSTQQFGSNGTQVGVSVGTVSCNNGDQNLNWFAMPNTDHPVIPQNLFRMSGGASNDERFEQIGQSWLKHAFTALTGNACGLGCNGVGGSQLGVGCSDPYGASLNASQSGLGSRAWVNPFTGFYPSTARDHTGHNDSNAAPTHRALVEMTDLNTTMNPGATYFAEAQYVTPHEYAWCQSHPGQCNMYNNASYRQFSVTGTTSFTFSPIGNTVRTIPAINAWPGATINTIEPEPGVDGRAFIAFKVTGPVAGIWHYEYAINNQNLDRSIQSLSVPLGCGITLTNVGFHAPLNHPGIANDGTQNSAGYSNAAWTPNQTTGAISWSTETFAQNQNANAIRWGTLYNFRFDSDRPPLFTNATIGYFKNGNPTNVVILAPNACNATPTPVPTPTPSPGVTVTPTPTSTPTPTTTPGGTPPPTPCGTATFSNPVTINIPDVGAATPYPSNIAVAMAGTITKVTVKLNNLSHSFPSDIDVLLVGPGGQNAIIMSDVGGGADITGVTLTLDDAAANSMPASTLTTGTYKPTNNNGSDFFPAPAPLPSGGSPLSVFNGTSPNGTWSLYVVDGAGDDQGSFAGGWELNITTNSVCATPTPSPSATSTPSASPTISPPPTTPPPPSPTPTISPPPMTPPPPTPTPTISPPPSPTPTPSTPTPTPPTSTPTPIPGAQPNNLSTRMRVQTGDSVGIGGFIITGSAPKHVLLRAIGPSLTQAGVPNALADPVLELHGPGGFATISNDNWRDDPAQQAAILATGLAPTNNLESAIDTTLSPGAYTAVVRGKNNTSGVGLVEIYDLSLAVAAKLANISTRALVGTGDNIVIAGFTLGGQNGDGRIVVRGLGPSLAALGMINALANPTLELRDGNGALLMANNDWQENPTQMAELMGAGLAPANVLESAIAATLPPGPYTALLAGLNNGAGIGLVEVYDRGAP